MVLLGEKSKSTPVSLSLVSTRSATRVSVRPRIFYGGGATSRPPRVDCGVGCARLRAHFHSLHLPAAFVKPGFVSSRPILRAASSIPSLIPLIPFACSSIQAPPDSAGPFFSIFVSPAILRLLYELRSTELPVGSNNRHVLAPLPWPTIAFGRGPCSPKFLSFPHNCSSFLLTVC